MRRHESRRGARVTVEADLEGVEPRKESVGERRRACPSGRQQRASRDGQWRTCSPGSEAVSSLTLRVGGNQGDPGTGPQAVGTRERV